MGYRIDWKGIAYNKLLVRCISKMPRTWLTGFRRWKRNESKVLLSSLSLMSEGQVRTLKTPGEAG